MVRTLIAPLFFILFLYISACSSSGGHSNNPQGNNNNSSGGGVNNNDHQIAEEIKMDAGTYIVSNGVRSVMEFGNKNSELSNFSPDGTKVVFYSEASNLVSGDTNGKYDVFVFDIAERSITRVSTNALGEQLDRESVEMSFDPSGNKVLMTSSATNMHPSDVNGFGDVFAKNLTTGAVELLSLTATGEQPNNASYSGVLSSDGSKFLFATNATNEMPGVSNGIMQIYMRNIGTGEVTLVSSNSVGEPGNSIFSYYPVFSPDEEEVLFQSYASNFVAGDTNSSSDIYIKDLMTGEVELVSSNASGNIGNQASAQAIFVPGSNGRKVIFESFSNNLVAGDTNNAYDVFIKDRDTGAIIRVSTDSLGNQGNASSSLPSVSADGTKAVFASIASNLVAGDTNESSDIFLKDLNTGVVTIVSRVGLDGELSNGPSSWPRISADGTKVVFMSDATNLDPGSLPDVTNVFIKDLNTGEIYCISKAMGEATKANNNSIKAHFSIDGNNIVFESYANNLVLSDDNGKRDIFVKDLIKNRTTLVSTSSSGVQGNGDSENGRLSNDNKKVVFQSSADNLVPDDTNDLTDIFVKNLDTGAIVRVSVNKDGEEANDICNNGQFSPTSSNKVLFQSYADNLVPDDTNSSMDLFIKDLSTGVVTRVSTAVDGTESSADSYNASFSADGKKVVFESYADNLIPNDTNSSNDIFIKNIASGVVTRVSVAADGTEADSSSYNPSLSADGKKVIFESMASNLVPGYSSGGNYIYIKDLQTGEVSIVSANTEGAVPDSDSYNASISADGKKAIFESLATNLVADDTNGTSDIFIKDLTSGVITRVTGTEGQQANSDVYNASFSPSGKKILFDSNATNMTGTATNGVYNVFLFVLE